MSNHVGHRLVGYSRVSERVADEHAVPGNLMRLAKELAHVPATDPDAAMVYPLDAGAARDLAGALGAAADTTKNEYFLEGFAA
jgi:hypothetical protein